MTEEQVSEKERVEVIEVSQLKRQQNTYERVKDFLRKHKGKAYCKDYLSRKLFPDTHTDADKEKMGWNIAFAVRFLEESGVAKIITGERNRHFYTWIGD